MASSNRHWPSMFKSKPCNPTHHQWQHDLLSSTACHRTPYTPVGGCEERTPEPKPRWNPRPEQIRILESIFNSGMVNPPREEIRKIRAQLQEYGQVGDANVFYWFQNRKSRSKHKQRQQLHKPSAAPPPTTTISAAATLVTAPTSSSSSSDKSSPNKSIENSISVAATTPATVIDLLNSPTASVNQHGLFHDPTEFLTEPAFFFPVQQNPTASALSQGFCFPDVNVSGADQNTVPSFLLSELMLMNHGPVKKSGEDDHEKMKLQQQLLGFNCAAPNNTVSAAAADHSVLPPPLCIPTPATNIFQGITEAPICPARSSSTVYINDLCFEVGVGPFNVREAFGEDAVLLQSTGQPVVMNAWGVTLHPLQHGASYYLVTANTVALTPDHARTTIDLI